ncbi:uncharacterized protein [Triticum aestivum]|uniref:uncharacterized protein isoform X1 n=1 Tax=Triticum aestivum TaxID=4565 RepID=UPI001D0077A8|nr:uncharacterized protein LOC123185426 isoform X1 [Triticum aestivum]
MRPRYRLLISIHYSAAVSTPVVKMDVHHNHLPPCGTRSSVSGSKEKMNKSGLVHKGIARRTFMEKSSQLADFSRKGLPTGSNARCGTVKKYKLPTKDGNDALTNTPIMFSTNWDAGDSKTMNDQVDASNESDMGNSMDEFYGFMVHRDI